MEAPEISIPTLHFQRAQEAPLRWNEHIRYRYKTPPVDRNVLRPLAMRISSGRLCRDSQIRFGQKITNASKPPNRSHLLRKCWQSRARIIPGAKRKHRVFVLIRCRPRHRTEARAVRHRLSECARECMHTPTTTRPQRHSWRESVKRRIDPSEQNSERGRGRGEASATKFTCHPTRQKNEAGSGERRKKSKVQINRFQAEKISACDDSDQRRLVHISECEMVATVDVIQPVPKEPQRFLLRKCNTRDASSGLTFRT